jgi:hypothetical protein
MIKEYQLVLSPKPKRTKWSVLYITSWKPIIYYVESKSVWTGTCGRIALIRLLGAFFVDVFYVSVARSVQVLQ